MIAGINPQSTTPSALGVQGLERTDSEHTSKTGRTINLQMLGVTQGGLGIRIQLNDRSVGDSNNRSPA